MITTYNYTIEEGEKGFVLVFPSPTNIKPSDQYLVYFDVPIALPKTPPTTVSFEPKSASYSILGSTPFSSGASSITPKIFVKIKSTQKIQTKTLVRLLIKDTKNNILHTDYALIICSPNSITSAVGSLTISVGPKGGSVLNLTSLDSNQTSIYVRSNVTGPGIPTNRTVSVASVIGDNQVELSEIIAWSGTAAPAGTYTFSISFDCIDSASLVENSASSTYMALDINNNWTYKIRDHVIAKFIPEDPVQNGDLVVLLPIKNTALLGLSNNAHPIPATCIIKGGGRVIRDTIPLSNF